MKKTISLPVGYTEKLKKEKMSTGQSMSEIIRRALDLYFKGRAY
jgi:predicted CopG family antitoxin